MFQRKKNSLPTTSLSLPTRDQSGGLLSNSNRAPDGSGKAIKMDAPIVKSWKKASGFTKGSYYTLAFFLFLIFLGYRYLIGGNGPLLRFGCLLFLFFWRDLERFLTLY